jgi:hypothetical protein
VIIGRAATTPLPEAFTSRLEAPLAQIGSAFAGYFRGSGAALRAGAAEIAALRSEGLTRSLPGDEAERFFALGFALEQMHSNFKDLERCVAERAGTSQPSKRGEPE